MAFGFTFTDKEKYTLINLTGNLMEKNQAAELMEAINNHVEKSAANFIINFSDFKYMNSTGLNVLLNILNVARKSGGEAVICCVPEKIRTLLVITKLNNVFAVKDDEKHAAEVFIKGDEVTK